MDFGKKEKRQPKLQIEQYLESRGEVRELERLLQESRVRYRKEAKNIRRQTWGDYFREWKEWIFSKDEWISREISKNEMEISYFQGFTRSMYLSNNTVENDLYESYNAYLNKHPNYYDMDTDEI